MDNISISLPAQAWNVILNALGQRPFVEVTDLIAELKKQAESQLPTPAPVEQAE
jgi:hypothetical protein